MFLTSKTHVFFNDKAIFENWDGIYNVIFYKDTIIVCYKSESSFRNVCMLDSNGKILWEIDKNPPEAGEHFFCNFTGLSIDKSNNFWAYNSSGYNYQYIPDTGEILTLEFVR